MERQKKLESIVKMGWIMMETGTLTVMTKIVLMTKDLDVPNTGQQVVLEPRRLETVLTVLMATGRFKRLLCQVEILLVDLRDPSK